MNIKLPKPIVFLDLETTGTNISQDRIIQIALLKINPDHSKETKEFLINPGIPIPKESTLIHGITNEMVASCPNFKEKAHEILRFIGNADIAGYNIQRFDFPLLVEELLRYDIDFDFSKKNIIDIQTIYHKMEARTLAAAYRFYCHKELTQAHSAMADTQATYEVFLAQLEKYKEQLPDYNTLTRFACQQGYVDYAGRIIYNEANIPVFNFGKYKGKPVVEVFEKEPQYYDWIQKGDFPLHTKKVVTQLWVSSKMQKK